MQTSKIVTESIKDQIYEILKEEIISGELPPGEQLVEQTIADRFHTSRSPVREAIKQLTGDGLVVNITNKGTFVKMPTFDELKDMQEMRQILEVFAVNKVIHSFSDEDKTELQNLRQRIIDSREANDPEIYLDLERTIWTSIIMMTGNSYVIDSYCKLYAITTNFSKSVIKQRPDSFGHSIEERIAIIDALCSGNAQEAVRITEEHLQRGTQILYDTLEHLRTSGKG